MIRILKKNRKFIVTILFLVIVCIIYKSHENMSFFFKDGTGTIEYDGYIYSLDCNEIRQTVNLNIEKIQTFENGILYVLELEQIDVENEWDEIRMGRRYLGYFYVTEDEIYRVPVASYGGYTEEQTKEVVKGIKDDVRSFMEQATVVCSEEGTTEQVDKNGYHTRVAVDGDKRIFQLFNEYTGGTKDYETIVWQRGKGIVYYKRGAGNMLMHVEFESKFESFYKTEEYGAI